jgi:hypothetical protein
LLVPLAIELHPTIRVGHRHDPVNCGRTLCQYASAVRIGFIGVLNNLSRKSPVNFPKEAERTLSVIRGKG